MSSESPAAGNAPANAPSRIEILLVGMNGDLRGKQIPLEAEKKVWDGTVRLPSSTQSLDIWGDDNDDITGLSLSVGDPDGECVPDRRSLAALPWAPPGSKQVLATMHELDGTPSFMCPRAILANLLKRFDERGLTPVVATELEFYVVQDDWRVTGRPRPPERLMYRDQPNGFQLYDMSAVDALAAADDCIYLKRVAEQAARRHGLKSTCMAKPYADQAGSGLHVHASILDRDGRNVLDAKGGDPKKLKSICAGMLKTMRDAQLIFAPFANSYRRFQPGSFAPVDIDWG
ncbi:MAG TPA: glutamine synthetase, partial [Mycoplana sp.]|nr:glutamine synthetase [Mycoplana sp.]